MAVSSTGRANFELSYTGSRTYPDKWDISVIDLKFEGSKTEISAKIDEKISETKEQILKLDLRSNSGNAFQDKMSERSVDRVSLKVEVLKTLKFSARIFQTYENRNLMIRQPDGTYRGEVRARRDNLPVFIENAPNIEEGKYYRVKIKNEKNHLNATISEVNVAASDMERKQQEASKAQQAQQNEGMDLISQGLKNLSMALGNQPGAHKMGEGFKNMVATMQQSGRGNSELDNLDVAQLQARYKAATEELQTARFNLNSALSTQNEAKIMEAITLKQKISQKVMELGFALERKGIKVEVPKA